MAQYEHNGLLVNVVPPLASGLIRVLNRSVRCERFGHETLYPRWQSGERVLLAFWHDQLLMMPKGYCGPGAKILVSASQDGELLARSLARFGLPAVRGSSSRGGDRAFRELLRVVRREPWDIGITPDGPRGPRHKVKPGIAQLARLTRRAVVPLAFAASRGHRFSSWDRFLLPYPGSRGVFYYGEPLTYTADEDPAQFCHRLEQALNHSTACCQEILERHGLSAI